MMLRESPLAVQGQLRTLNNRFRKFLMINNEEDFCQK